MSTETPQFEWIRKGWLLAGIVVALGVWLFTRPQKQPDSLNVPLGVEQAAIVTYSGPPIAVTPYKWGVAVNVRIARVSEQPGARIYDVRYIVNRAGHFRSEGLTSSAEDGSALEGLPSFQFHGDPKLSKQLDTRIQETEEVARGGRRTLLRHARRARGFLDRLAAAAHLLQAPEAAAARRAAAARADVRRDAARLSRRSSKAARSTPRPRRKWRCSSSAAGAKNSPSKARR